MQTTSPNIRAVAGRPEQAHSDNTSSRSPLATALALAAMSLGLGVVQLDITIVNTALSSIGASLGGSVAELQWVVTAYTIAFAAFILTAGALGDRLGAKRIFMAGFAIFTLASLACALAPSAVFLIVARSVQGLAAAILVPNSLTLLNHAYADPKERGRAVGFWAAGASVALTAGPFVGGVLIALVGWRSIFLVNLPIGAAGLWLAWRYAEETPRLAQREIDLPGQVAAITALGVLAGALIEGGRLGWSHPLVIVGFAAAAVVGFLFVWREARAPQPMLPLSLFAHRMFALTARYAPPPPPGVAPPPQWGDPRIVSERLGNAVKDIVFERARMLVPVLSPQHLRTTMERTAGPVIKMVESLSGADPAKLAAFRAEFEALAGEYLEENVVRQDYLLTRALKI